MAIAPGLPRGVAAAIDLAFLPALGVALGRPLVAARNRRNFVMLAVLALLFVANLVVHLDALGLVPLGSARRANLAALDVVLFLIAVIAARIFPMFTRNATGVASIASRPRLDVATAIGMGLLVISDVVLPETTLARLLAGGVGILAIARATRWGMRHSFRDPMLWILHVGYAWLPLGLILRALPAIGVPVWSSLATHALTVGALGSLTLGMMARVSLGHTGRRIVATRAVAASFALVTAATIARALVPLFAIAWHHVALVVAAALWAGAFGIYLVVYVPVLASPRPDGKAG
jgi:uncharacterized protein involved in response to NO